MKKRYIVIIVILLVLITSVLVYLNTYYKAESVNDYLKSNDIVEVKKDKNGYYFDGPGEDNILVFYPGAKVEYVSYAPLMSRLAEQGVDTFLVKMPFNIAFFDGNAIKDIMKDYKYDNWYLSGHSLGGVVAASYTSKHDDIKGLILLASYSTKKVDCRVLSIYGSNDKVLNIDKFNENRKFLPDDSIVVKIDGGNHAFFGNYGPQKGDGNASISRKEQQEITTLKIIDFIEEN